MKFKMLIKSKYKTKKSFLGLKLFECCIFYAKKAKMPTMVGIFTLISMICSVDFRIILYNLGAISRCYKTYYAHAIGL